VLCDSPIGRSFLMKRRSLLLLTQ